MLEQYIGCFVLDYGNIQLIFAVVATIVMM